MKNVIIALLYSTVLVPCYGATQINMVGGSNDGLDFLRNEIRKLEYDLEQKTQALNKCAEKNKNFKIAGIATIGLTGIGVATNISLYSKMKDQVKQGNNMAQGISNTNEEWKDFLTELNSLDIDWDKYDVAAKEEGFTSDDYKYLLEHDFFNGVSVSSMSESDRNLLRKYDRVLYKSKKDNKKE